jgi:AhpD family alkylhydroperoxidase
VTLRRTWESIEQIMPPEALDACTKEMIYLTASVTNQCKYCTASHTRQRSQGRHDGRDA